MNYPERMSRVAIVAPNKHLHKTIEILYKAGVLHIVEHTKGAIDIGSPLPGSADFADLLVKSRSLLHSLGVQPTTPLAELRGDIEHEINKLHSSVTQLVTQVRDLDSTVTEITRDFDFYQSVRWVKISPALLHDSAHLAFIFGTVKDKTGLEAELSHITKSHYLEQQHEGNGILLIVDKEKAEASRKVLDAKGFSPIDVTQITRLTTSFDEHLAGLDKTMHTKKRELQYVHEQLTRLRDEKGGFLLAAEQLLSEEATKAQTPLRFGVTKNSFIANGWVPKNNLEQLRSDLSTQLHNEFHLEVLSTKEEAPVKLKNSLLVSPFESLLSLYTLPSYKEIDPSSLMFLSFPIFFGFMLGDIGYGLVMLILFSVLRMTAKKNTMMRSLASILILSAIASIVFGFVFGEFFGAEEIGHIHLHPLIHRAHDMTTLLYVAVAAGIIHITIGLIIGFVNELHHHGTFKAFAAKLSWLVLLVAVGLIAGGALMQWPTAIYGYVLGAASIVLIYLGEGIKGLVELPGIFSNILSYARLMAIGVASALLAIVVNEMAGGMFASHSVGGIIAGVLLLIVGHAINLALGIIGPFLHSLRLHYVEFFSKFYEGGGKPYKPFGVDRE